jgi:Zn-dependent peptidase ImmA (M78 family)/DNA-binding XRE family transcriptional regulator
MRAGTPGFTGQRLREARDVRALSASSLSDLTGVSPQAIYQYESNRTSPSPQVLSLIADVLQLPAAFFVQAERPVETAEIFYRSMATATMRARRRARVRLRWLRDIEDYLTNYVALPEASIPDLGLPTNPLLLSDDEIDEAADQLRQHWRLGDAPIANMVLLLENHGVVVARDNLGAESLDGISQMTDDSRPLVIIGTDKGSSARWRFDASHELGHLVLHANTSAEYLNRPDLYRRIEDQAHRFAAAFLLPLGPFGEDLFAVSLDAFRALKPKWNVSIAMMIIRARSTGLLSEAAERKLWTGMSRRKWRVSEPYDDSTPHEEPRLLRRSFEMILQEGDQTPADVLSRLAISPSDVESLSGLNTGYLANYSRVSRIARPVGRDLTNSPTRGAGNNDHTRSAANIVELPRRGTSARPRPS